MAQSIQKDISRLESSIAEYSKSKLYFSSECEELRLKARDLYEQILFVDYEYALQNDIEQSLWKNSFYKGIEEHRKKLRHYYHATKNGSQSAVAELSKECQIFRKLLQSYSSFYISLINKLEEHYKLTPVKLLMKGEELEGIDTSNSHKSILSCFRCLIYLGDLTRYHRDLFNDPHQKDWKNASNYYRKAFLLIPHNGNPHNQLAVLSTYTDDDIETVYRYYRSIVIKYPFLTAAENLVVLFEKNIPKYTAYRRELHSPNKTRNLATRPNAELFKSFVLSFVRLHGMIYSKADTSLFFEIKLQVIKDLAVLLNRDLLTEEILLKLIIINISSIALDIHRCSSQSPPHSPSKEFKKITYLYSIEFISAIISKAHKSQNNSKILGSIITCIEWLLTQSDISTGFQKKEKRIWISFWKNVAQLLTHIHASRYATPELASIIETREGLPLLPEEIELKGFLPLEQSHQHLPLTSSRNNISANLSTQENYRAIRITKLLHISKALCKKFPILYFSQKDAKYIVSRADPHPKSPILSPILQQRPSYILSPNRATELINNTPNVTPPISGNDSYYKNNSPHSDTEITDDLVNINNNNNNINQYHSNNTDNYIEDDGENADELDLNQIEMENHDNERRAQIEEEIASYDVNDFDEDDELLDEIILFKPRNSTEEIPSDSFQIPNVNENNTPLSPQNQIAANQFLNFGNTSNNNTKNGEFNLFYSGLSIDNYNIFNYIKNPTVEDKSNHNDHHSSFFENTDSNQSFFANGNSNSENSLWGFSNYSFFSNSSPQQAWHSPNDPLPSQTTSENNKTQVTIIENPFPQIFQSSHFKSPYQDWS